MAHGSGEALASEYYEMPRMETKRKFEEDPRDWDEGKDGIPAAFVPSCSNVRPPLTDATPSVADIVNRSFEKSKRSRMEPAGKGRIDPACTNGDDNFKWVHEEPAEETFPMHREQDAQFYKRACSHQQRKIDVPNFKVKLVNGKGSPETRKIDAVSAGGAASVEAPDYRLNVRDDKGNSITLNLTEEIQRVMNQVSPLKFAVKIESKEGWQLSLTLAKDNV